MQLKKDTLPEANQTIRNRTRRSSGRPGDMADEDRRSDAVLSKEIQDIGKRPAIQQQTLYFFNCKYAIDLPSLTLQQMYWSRAEALGDVIGLVMGENMEMETVQKRSIHPGHKIPPFTRLHQTSPNYDEEKNYFSVKKRSIHPGHKIPPFTRLHQTSPNYDEEDNYFSVQKRSIHPGHPVLGHHIAPLSSPKADDSFSPTSPATSLTCSSDLQTSPKFRDKSSLNFPPASCQTSDSLFQTPVSTPGPRSSSVQTLDLLKNKMSDINLKISTLSTYHEGLLSNKQGGIFGSLLVLESIECAGKECLPSVGGSKGGHRGRKVAIAGWSEHCKPYQDECKFWHSMWQSLGKPSVGQVYWTMRHTRNQYKYAIRRLKRSQYKIQNDKFVSSLINRGVNIFQEIQKYRGKSCTISSRIDDEVGRIDDEDDEVGSLLVGEPMSTPKCHLNQSTSNDPCYFHNEFPIVRNFS